MRGIDKANMAVRLAIVIFWAVIILCFLQLPNLNLGAQKTLYIATWPLTLDAQYIHAFEKETGIKLEITYFERSEELYSKLKATKGHGYDIILPSDYTVALLIKEGLLKKLDRSKLTFWDKLDPRLLGNYFDPYNDYSIPFFWGVYGIGYNKEIYGENPPSSWSLLFDEYASRVVMADTPREVVFMTAQYLFGSLDALKAPGAQEQVRKLLIAQKPRVSLYTDERIDDLLSSENSTLAFGLSTDISRAEARNHRIGFLIPDEGSFFIIDSIAIAKHSRNTDLAYTFINYLYQLEVIGHHVSLFNMCSPLKQTQEKSGYCPDNDVFHKLHFLQDVITEDELNSIWINLLSV